jgi:hypothetical protein
MIFRVGVLVYYILYGHGQGFRGLQNPFPCHYFYVMMPGKRKIHSFRPYTEIQDSKTSLSLSQGGVFNGEDVVATPKVTPSPRRKP